MPLNPKVMYVYVSEEWPKWQQRTIQILQEAWARTNALPSEKVWLLILPLLSLSSPPLR